MFALDQAVLAYLLYPTKPLVQETAEKKGKKAFAQANQGGDVIHRDITASPRARNAGHDGSSSWENSFPGGSRGENSHAMGRRSAYGGRVGIPRGEGACPYYIPWRWRWR